MYELSNELNVSFVCIIQSGVTLLHMAAIQILGFHQMFSLLYSHS